MLSIDWDSTLGEMALSTINEYFNQLGYELRVHGTRRLISSECVVVNEQLADKLIVSVNKQVLHHIGLELTEDLLLCAEYPSDELPEITPLSIKRVVSCGVELKFERGFKEADYEYIAEWGNTYAYR